MKKIIRITESELINLVKGIINEQQDKLITPSPSKSSGNGQLISTVGKTDSNSWFSSFPCLNEVPQSKRQMVNGNVVLSTSPDGRKRTLLPVSGKGDPAYRYVENYKPINNYIGQIQGGGVYYCSSEAYAKGFGPQTMKIN
jgi:hypothetical protein